MSWSGKYLSDDKVNENIWERGCNNKEICRLRYARHGEGEGVVIREFFAADVEGIESVGAVGAVFEQVFLGLGEFFAGLILAEAVATVGDTG